jgi:GT2 family glycosyltransferase
MPSPTAVYTVFSTRLETSSTEMAGMGSDPTPAIAGVRGPAEARRYPARVVEPNAEHVAPRPVVVVVVTHDPPGDRRDALLAALAAQDHPNLDVLVVDTGHEDLTEPVHAVLPEARVERRPGAGGFGAAANTVLDLVTGAEFYVFCHDDVEPDPGAVSALVAAAEHWDAAVVGPKLVASDDDRRLLQFGVTVDKVGVTLPLVERRELDQGQHDGLRDVFAVPGAFTLVRASTFAEVGGFDEAISFLNDDLSLCWRIRVAGGRVLVTSAARVRHAEAFATRPRAGAAPALAARHRVRVLLTSYRGWTLATIVPQALALGVVEAVTALVTGRAGRARAALGAWPWNLARLGSLLAARRSVRSFRRVKDHEVRRHQAHGLVRPRVRRLRVEGDGLLAAGRWPAGRRVAAVPERGHMTVDPTAWAPATVAIAAVIAGVLLFGSRHLLTRHVPVVGEMVPFPGTAGDLLGAWAGGVRPSGVAGGPAPPTLAGGSGALGALLAGHLALARTLLTVGLLAVGVIGAHRLGRSLGAKAAQVAGALAYAALPLPYEALGTGRWSVLGAWAGAPWMLRRLALASGTEPFTSEAGRQGLGLQIVAAGAVTALVGLVVPQAPVLLVLMGVALALGTLLGLEMRGILALLATAAGGAVVAALLLLPTTLDVLGSPAAFRAWLGGPTAAEAADTAFGPAAALVAGAALVPLLVGRRWRLGWALRAWALVAACGVVVWAGEQGGLGGPRPDPGVVLAPAAAALALAVGLGVAAIPADVTPRSWRFGLRRLVVVAGAVALLAATVPTGRAAVDGRWGMPSTSYASVVGFIDRDPVAEDARVLWVGDPALVPGGEGWALRRGLTFASSIGSLPGVADLWPATGSERATSIRRALNAAVDGETTRLGAALAASGVAYVAVPLARAPGEDTAAAPATGDLTGALAEQLDLEQVQVDRDLVLYRNAAFDPGPAARAAPPPPDGLRPATAAQAALWLVALALVVRMRFAASPVPAATGHREPLPAASPAEDGGEPERARVEVGV